MSTDRAETAEKERDLANQKAKAFEEERDEANEKVYSIEEERDTAITKANEFEVTVNHLNKQVQDKAIGLEDGAAQV